MTKQFQYFVLFIAIMSFTMLAIVVNINNDPLDLAQEVTIHQESEINQLIQIIDNHSLYKFENREIYQALLQLTGDDYAEYYSEKDYQEIAQYLLEGTYSGIGIVIDKNLEIIEVFDNSPAQKSGIKQNDIIIKINEKDTTNMTNYQASSLIRGDVNTFVDITVNRFEETNIENQTSAYDELIFTTKRENINYPVISGHKISSDTENLFYLKIFSFNNNTVEQIKNLQLEKYDGLIMDLRNNAGGCLQSSLDISGLFVTGEMLTIKNSNNVKDIRISESSEYNMPVIVMVNRHTASAAEILAGILQHYGSTIIGETTYGKGIAQEFFPIGTGAVKLTTNEFLLPDDKSIHGIGINACYEIIEEDLEKIITDFDKSRDFVVDLLF